MNLLSLVETRVGKPERNRHYGCLEYSGPCPWCGGQDRFHVYPDLGPLGWFHCLGSRSGRAGCDRKGDAIQYVMLRTGATFASACQTLGLDPCEVQRGRNSKRENGGYEIPRSAPTINASWQMTALAFVRLAEATLEKFPIAVEYLLSRGLTRQMIREAHLGYYPTYKMAKAETWGLSGSPLLLPAGIVIPWIDRYSSVTALRIRHLPTDETEPAKKYYATCRYRFIRGSQTDGLYREDTARSGGTVAMFEGEFDALIAHHQEIATVATGSTSGARNSRVLSLLANQEQVLICFDTDENKAGEKGASWWLARLANAKRWRPLWKDANAMSMSGADIGAWLSLGLHEERKDEMPDGTVKIREAEETFHCALCDSEVEHYLEEGLPLCEKHYRMYEMIPVLSYEPTEEEQAVLDLLQGDQTKLLYACRHCGCRIVWRCMGDWMCVVCSPGERWRTEVRDRLSQLREEGAS